MKPGTSSAGLGKIIKSCWRGFGRDAVTLAYIRARRKLTLRERTALLLVEVERRSYREAALILGISPRRFKMLVFRARGKLCGAMEKALESAPKP